MSYTVSCVKIRFTADIQPLCIVYSCGWDIARKKSKHLGHYDTPTEPGKKWQLDVKYVPVVCYVGTDGEKFYQYTMLEEAGRKRLIYAYRENSSYST